MTMIDAARLMVANGERNIVFVFAGDDRVDPRYTRALRRRARMHGIDTLCRFVGHCADMPAALAAADVVVVPALEPPLSGRAAAEAQAMGRPVVVTTVGVLPENMLGPPRMPDELRTGWLVRPGNVADLARATSAGARASTPPPTRRSARARGNSPSSCSRRRALPKPSAGSIRRCWHATPEFVGTVASMSSFSASGIPAQQAAPVSGIRRRPTPPDIGETRDPIKRLDRRSDTRRRRRRCRRRRRWRAFSAQAGHRATVVSRPGRLVADVTAAGAEFMPLNMAGNNPVDDPAQRRWR